MSLAAATQAAKGLTRLGVSAVGGRRWLDEHRERVDELLGRSHADAPILQPVVTQVWQAD